MNPGDSIRVDKSVLTVSSLSQQSDDKAYWLSKTPEERLQAVEILRQLNYGYKNSSERIQRVFEVVQHPPR